MYRFLPQLAEQSVPRYTSYPTAAQFSDGVGAADQARALQAVALDRDVSLYVHIPYCHEICWYCGCNTGAIGKAERVGQYRDALLTEIETVSRVMHGRVVSVHFGGGSPNALAPDDLMRVARAIRQRFRVAEDAEWAAELDPRTLDAAYAVALAAAGITRASLGAQTFSAPVQAKINRIQPFAKVAECVADLRRAGIPNVNLDLMYGLPGQTQQDVRETIAAALTLAPDRVAMFGYAHMPRMLSRQRMIDETALPEAEERFEQSALAHALLTEAGYAAIGFDHFARPEDSIAVAAREGRLRRNFQGFTDDPASVLVGLGSTAISQFDDVIVQNEKHVGRYRLLARNGALTGARGVALDADDRFRAALIERLLCDGRIDLAAFSAAHGRPVQALAPALPELVTLAAEGVVVLDGWRIEITQLGRPYARLAAAAFDAYRMHAGQRFSKAV